MLSEIIPFFLADKWEFFIALGQMESGSHFKLIHTLRFSVTAFLPRLLLRKEAEKPPLRPVTFRL